MNHITGIVVDNMKNNFQFFPNPTIFSKGTTSSVQTIEDDNITYGREFNSIHMSNFKSTPLPKTDRYVGFTAEGTFLT